MLKKKSGFGFEFDLRFRSVKTEIEHLYAGTKINESLADCSFSDHVLNKADNVLAADRTAVFKALFFISLIFVVVQGLIWLVIVAHEQMDILGKEGFVDSVYLSTQMFMIAGFNDKIAGDIPLGHLLRFFFLVMIFISLLVFALLVGLVRKLVGDFLYELAQGRSKVAERDHTLILGWNEATIRSIKELGLHRRQYQVMNGSCPRRWGLKKKYSPATHLATGNIIVVANKFSKGEMDAKIRTAFDSQGDTFRHTVVGRNVVCRVGDPTNIYDLVNVGATRALAILIMMTEDDYAEEEASDGRVCNGATIRTLLALRAALLANAESKKSRSSTKWGVMLHPDLRIVVQLSKPSYAVKSACFKDHRGREQVLVKEIGGFLDTLMFSCFTQKGLAKVVSELLDVEGQAIRKRKVSDIVDVKAEGPFAENGGGSIAGLTFREAQERLENAVLLGIVHEGEAASYGQSGDSSTMHIPHHGLAPDPGTKLRPDDYLVFCSDVPMPAFVQNFKKNSNRGKVCVKPVTAYLEKRQKSILILGWRAQWKEEPDLIRGLLKSVLNTMSEGSNLVLINRYSAAEFKELAAGLNFKAQQMPDEDGWLEDHMTHYIGGGCSMYHVEGDATDMKNSELMVEKFSFDAAIVLGSIARSRLSSVSKDTRVLVMMLQLRRLIEKYNKPPIYIVSENEFDHTAKVAPAGLTAEQRRGIDVVNAQGIIAAALTQSLANPSIHSALHELFEETPGLPNFRLVRAGAVLELGKELSFGEVLYAVAEQNEQSAGWRCAVCVGYMTTHTADMKPDMESIVVAPKQTDKWKYNEKDKLICILRDLSEIEGFKVPPCKELLVGQSDVVVSSTSSPSDKSTEKEGKHRRSSAQRSAGSKSDKVADTRTQKLQNIAQEIPQNKAAHSGVIPAITVEDASRVVAQE